jgi:hypothetical protein
MSKTFFTPIQMQNEYLNIMFENYCSFLHKINQQYLGNFFNINIYMHFLSDYKSMNTDVTKKMIKENLDLVRNRIPKNVNYNEIVSRED